MRRTATVATTTLLLSLVLAACSGTGAASPSAAAPSEAASTAPSVAPSDAPSVAPSPSAGRVRAGDLALKTAGTLTIGADNPAYPPYFAHREGGNTPPWEDSDFTATRPPARASRARSPTRSPTSSASRKDKVTWIVVPFTNSFAPGAKDFDFYIDQVSYKPERAQAADLSDGYYTVLQSVVALKDSPLAKATTVAGLADYTFGAQVGTTSYDTIVNTIKPTKEPQVFDTNDLAIEALKSGQIDGIVVDLPTADFITNVQVENAVAVGKFDDRRRASTSRVVLEQGQRADGVRQRRDRGAQRRRHASRASSRSGCRSRRASRCSSPRRLDAHGSWAFAAARPIPAP